jgi:hypothetical protein
MSFRGLDDARVCTNSLLTLFVVPQSLLSPSSGSELFWNIQNYFHFFATVCHLHSWTGSSTDHEEMLATVWLMTPWTFEHVHSTYSWYFCALYITIRRMDEACSINWKYSKCVKLFVYNIERSLYVIVPLTEREKLVLRIIIMLSLRTSQLYLVPT